MAFWARHFREIISSIKTSSPSTSSSFSSLTGLLPVVMVTKLDLTDCVVYFDVANRLLAPKKGGAFASLVMVGGGVKLTKGHGQNMDVTCQFKDTYVHLVGGANHTPDDSEVLPSSSFHVWGRVLGLGSGTCSLSLSGDERPHPSVIINGRGQSIIFEISNSTLSTLIQLSNHFRNRYGNGNHDDTDTPTKTILTPTQSSTPPMQLIKTLIDSIKNISLTVEGLNGIIYDNEATPTSPLLLYLRVDSCSLINNCINFYSVGCDDLYYIPVYFECVSVCNLPSGGLLDIDNCCIQYNQVSILVICFSKISNL